MHETDVLSGSLAVRMRQHRRSLRRAIAADQLAGTLSGRVFAGSRAENPLNAVIDAYYREARTWETDRADQLRRTARAAWWVAGAACTCATAGGIALAALMPLKR